MSMSFRRVNVRRGCCGARCVLKGTKIDVLSFSERPFSIRSVFVARKVALDKWHACTVLYTTLWLTVSVERRPDVSLCGVSGVAECAHGEDKGLWPHARRCISTS